MKNFPSAVLVVGALAMLVACSGSNGSEDGGNGGPEISIADPDEGPVGPGNDVEVVADDSTLPGNDVETDPDVPVVNTGCGDGLCQGAETPESCAKDCLKEEISAAFVFAHKGDELASLGRIFDLAQAGATIYVFYLTYDDTPIDEYYSGQVGKLAPASLGVAAENIYAYEQYIDWGIVSGNHEALDRLTQHFISLEPGHIYLPQLCGGDFEDELAHIVGYWAAKRAKLFPLYYEVPVPSNYYIQEAPSIKLSQDDPDLFVDKFIKRWKLIPKGGEEMKTTLGTEDMAQLRVAAAHIQNAWFQDFLYKLPEDRLLYLLREIQRYRELPPDQKVDEKPYLESLENPQGTYIYHEQGYSFDEFKQMSRVIMSFYGTNLKTNPSALPFYDEPMDVKIVHDFEVELEMRAFSSEDDTLSFKIGFGPSKDPTEDCIVPDDIAVAAFEKKTITISCNAEEPIGPHTYYFRAYSDQAKVNNDQAKYTEIPLKVNVYQ